MLISFATLMWAGLAGGAEPPVLFASRSFDRVPQADDTQVVRRASRGKAPRPGA